MNRPTKKIKKRIKRSINKIKRDKYIYYYEKLPIDNDAILLESRNGKEFGGNIYYILKELLENPLYNAYKIYISAENDAVERTIYNKITDSQNKRITTIKSNTLGYYKAYASAKYIINDASIANFYIKKKGQVYLNTWHGTPFKVMGKKVKHEPHAVGNVQKNFVVADYLLYPNEYTRDHMIEDYMIRDICNAKILMTGYPRNTAFFDDNKRCEIRNKLSVDGHKVYVYMPTWRPTQNGEEISRILNEFETKLLEKEILYVKMHPLALDNINIDCFKKIKSFPADYETYEFLNISDALITDYSSVFYDYAITGRCTVLYTYDEEEYLATRGLYDPIDSLPFKRTSTVDDTLKTLRQNNSFPSKSFKQKYCQYDSVNATKALLERVILGNLNTGMKEESVDGNGLRNVLVKAGTLQPNSRTERAIEFLKNVDTSTANYFLTFNRNDILGNENLLFNLPKDINYFGVAGKPLKKFEFNRCYGDISFDEIVEVE